MEKPMRSINWLCCEIDKGRGGRTEYGGRFEGTGGRYVMFITLHKASCCDTGGCGACVV
jgi:hypothetical protein